jgi:16S rRNA (guanine527-N7)-methyltransferase
VRERKGVAVTQDLDATLRLLAELIAESPHNLVSGGDRPLVYARHIRECVDLSGHLPIVAGSRWIDVGTGGGLPGLVLAAMHPETAWTLVDSVQKKAAAVRDFAAILGLENVTVLAGRAENLAHDQALRESFDGAVSRAVAALPTLLELLVGFVRPKGLLAAVKGPRWPEEMEAARTAISALQLREDAVVGLATAERPSWVVMMRRDGDLRRMYPRRDGLPRTNPLGGS